ncbi:MAG: Cof-type HAD-IIB family hydrolase [Erysipelotrichaceae bacterium]|nr:Cof-type HAD-IIB family hydrolase [Erysipelotrichaceae bacterium]
MEGIKLIITDLDETLLTKEKKVTDYATEVIHELKKRDILFGIASGRMVPVMKRMMKDFGVFEDISVWLGANGADYEDKDGYKETAPYLNTGQMLDIYHKTVGLDTSCGVFDDENQRLVVSKENDAIAAVARSNRYAFEALDLEEYLIGKSFNKFFLVDEKEKILKHKEYLDSLSNKDYAGVYSGAKMYEFMHSSVSKSSGIKAICKHHQIETGNVLALGDSENDVGMLKTAGISICMGNGPDHVKEIADYIADTNENDGWARILDQLLELNLRS